jgi:restriction system protein
MSLILWWLAWPQRRYQGERSVLRQWINDQAKEPGMALWVVRAGRHGEREAHALKNGRALIGWEQLPDLGRITLREEVEQLLREKCPTYKPATIAGYTGQLWAFLHRMVKGDLVVMPLKAQPAIAVGEVTGPYAYVSDVAEDLRHGRPVRWLRTDLPRSELDQDLRMSIIAPTLFVFQVSRDDAEGRIRRMLDGRAPPRPKDSDVAELEPERTLDLSAIASDQIREHISRNYRSHDLSQLIGQILRAQGYQVMISPAGPDGGIDILAGSGPMGFDPPRIAVQVKSGDAPVDVAVLRELQGVMPRFGAEQGLIVSWGGFKDSVLKEARPLFFRIRLWDSASIIEALSAHYDQLPEALQAEIPMKRMWVLAEGE